MTLCLSIHKPISAQEWRELRDQTGVLVWYLIECIQSARFYLHFKTQALNLYSVCSFNCSRVSNMRQNNV